MNDVKNVIVVLSGKGGVGKSTVSTQLALQFHAMGHRVGILDIDICGPSVPYMLNLEGKVIHASSSGMWVPVYADDEKRLSVMSIGFIGADRNSAVIWRGPKKTGMIRQFLTNVLWENIDYLIVDTPPGTTDEHITIVERLKGLKNVGATIVTTPQYVSVEDARREVTFCRKANLPIIGVVENMNTFVCPNCSECSHLFSSGGGAALADASGVPLLGSLPIDPKLCEVGNTGESLITYHPTSPAAPKLKEVADKVLQFFISSSPSS